MPAKILVNMPGHDPAHPSGTARVGCHLLRALVDRGTYRYALRSAFRLEDLRPAFSPGEIDLVAVPPVRHKLLSIFHQSIVVPGVARRLGAALVLNIDSIGPVVCGPPRVTIIHDLFPRAIPDQYGFGTRWRFELVHQIVVRTSAALVAISETTARDAARFCPAACGRIAVAGWDTTLEEATSAAPPTMHVVRPYILTVANATPNKNLALIGRALRLLDARGVAVRLVHVGTDPNDTIRHAAGPDLRWAQILRVTAINDAELAGLYRGASCYVNTSFYEGFCLPLIEAQKLGCPVICSGRSATAEVVGDGALLCDPDDAAALAGHIEYLLHDKAARQALRAAGARNAARFSWDKTAAAYETIFAQLIGADAETGASSQEQKHQ